MFCPTCGREDSQERKFCPACGTNLERVTKVLSSGKHELLSQADEAFEKLMAQYAGLFFKSAPERAKDRSVVNSWLIFGQFLVALLVNFMLLPICFIALKLRFVILFFATPFRLLSERSERQTKTTDLSLLQEGEWLTNCLPSVTDHTTIHLSAKPIEQQTCQD